METTAGGAENRAGDSTSPAGASVATARIDSGAPADTDAAADPFSPEPAAGERRLDRRIVAVSLSLAGAIFVLVRLGPSLIGRRVFAGLDLLYEFSPFSSSPASHPLHTSVYVSDQLDATIPALHEIGQRFLHGDIAGWTSLVGGGSVLLATPDFAVLTPGRWLFLILPSWLALAWAKLLEMAFAAVFSYLLVRRLRGSKLAAGLAGFSYPLTGFMISWTNWPQVTVAAAIPMLFWSIERFVQERRIRAAIPVSLATALLLFGGFPAVAGQALYFGGGYALVRLVSTHRGQLKALARDVALLLVAVGLGIGLTAAELLPFAKATLVGTDLSYRDAGFFVHDGYRYMLTSVFPGSFGGNSLAPGASPMDLDSYVGAVIGLLAVLGLFHALSGRIRGVAGLYFVAMIGFIVGLLWFQGAWSNWMDHVPILHGNPINRIRSQLALPVVVLAAAGFDLLRGVKLRGGWWRRFGQASPVPVLAAAGVVCLALIGAGIKVANPKLLGFAPHRKPDLLLAIVPVVLITLLLVAALRFRLARTLALVVVVFSVSVQGIAATSFFWPTADRSEFYPSSAGIDYLRQHQGHDRMATLGYAVRPNVTEYYGLRVLNGHTFALKAMHDLIASIQPSAYVGNTYSIFGPTASTVVNSPGLGRMGVRYLVGDANPVNPAAPDSAAPVLGAADPVAPVEGSSPLAPGAVLSSTIAGGPIRAINVPVTASAAKSTVTVTLRSAAGAVIASNRRSMSTGSVLLPVPLAADPATASASTNPGRLTVEVSADVAGVSVRSGADGRIAVQPVRPSPKDNRVALAYAGDNLVVYERLDYVPRIHWATHASVIPDPAARLAAVTKSPLDQAGVILDRPAPGPLPTSDSRPQSLTVREDSGDTIRVAVQVQTAGFVVVADSIAGNFDATVDGKAATIESADYAVGAVYVPAGSHEIALHYDAAGRKNGNRISALSAVVLLLAIAAPLWGRFRRRGRRNHAS